MKIHGRLEEKEIQEILKDIPKQKTYNDIADSFTRYSHLALQWNLPDAHVRLFHLNIYAEGARVEEGTVRHPPEGGIRVMMKYLMIGLPYGAVIKCTDNGHVPAVTLYYPESISDEDLYDLLLKMAQLTRFTTTKDDASDNVEGTTAAIIANTRFAVLETMARSSIEKDDIPDFKDIEFPVYVVFHAGSHSDYTILPAPKEEA